MALAALAAQLPLLQALRLELQKKLTGLADTETGGTSINRAFDRDEIYQGPYRDNSPDLIIGYNAGYRASWEGVTGRITPRVFEDNVKCWSGDHCIDPALVPGVFCCNRALRDGSGPHIMDLAPTILDLMGVAVPSYMDGQALSFAEEKGST